MKILLLLLLFSQTAYAGDWSKADTVRESVYLGLHTVDWMQTREIARNPDKWHEQNIVLGRYPHSDRVDAYFIATGIGHYVISNVLPSEYRTVWQYLTIGVETGAVGHNYSLGIEVVF